MRRPSFNTQELRSFAEGSLIDSVPREADRPTTPLVPIFDRVLNVKHEGASGRIAAEQDLFLDVASNCSGIDAIWHLLGFYLVLRGLPGNPRALGCKEISCIGRLRSHHLCLRYEVSVTLITQLRQSGASIVVGDGVILADHEPIYSVKEAQVGAFLESKTSDDALTSTSGGLGELSPVLLARRSL